MIKKWIATALLAIPGCNGGAETAASTSQAAPPPPAIAQAIESQKPVVRRTKSYPQTRGDINLPLKIKIETPEVPAKVAEPAPRTAEPSEPAEKPSQD